MSLAQLWMQAFNWLMLTQGLIIIAFAGYITHAAFSPIIYVLFSLGGYTAFIGVLGIMMNNSRRKGCVTLFSVTFFALILFHAVLAIGFLFFEDKTMSVFKDLSNNSSDNEKVRNYLDNHHDAFKIASTIVLSVELLTWCLSICAARSVSGALDDDLYVGMTDTRSVGLLSAESAYVSATPQTDERRAQLSEKYGISFAKKNTTGSSTNPYHRV